MANQEHLKILAKGVDAWNRWRKENSDVLPDLRLAYLEDAMLLEADFSKTDFSGADLSRANASAANFSKAKLHEADLRRANLTSANLEGANLTDCYMWGVNLAKAYLKDADLSRATLIQAELQSANLTGASLAEAELTKANLRSATCSRADLTGADLSETNLSGTDFSGADLSEADLRRADLSGANLPATDLTEANFCEAIILVTRFSSKNALNDLKFELTQDQLIGCIFDDEQSTSRAKIRTETKAKQTQTTNDVIRVRFSDGDWSPYDFSMFYMALHVSINRLQYLLTTEEEEQTEISRRLSGPCYPENKDTIRVTAFSMQSEGWMELAYLVIGLFGEEPVQVLLPAAGALSLAYGVMKVRTEWHTGNKLKAEARLTNAQANNERLRFAQTVDTPQPQPPALITDDLAPNWREIAEPMSVPESELKAVADSFPAKSDAVRKDMPGNILQAIAPLRHIAAWMERKGMTAWFEVQKRQPKN